MDLRSKTRTLEGPFRSVEDLPAWNYDGSSTNQAPGQDSEVILVPRKVYRDPFRATAMDKDHILDHDRVMPTYAHNTDGRSMIKAEILLRWTRFREPPERPRHSLNTILCM